MRNKILRPGLVFLCYCLIACNHKSDTQATHPVAASATQIVASSPMNSSRTIPENIVSDTSCRILAEAFQSTGLMETLHQPGPFTLFAPTNEAFRRLPPGIFESLMKSRQSDLADILSYHIVAGSLKNREMRDGEKLKTLASDELIVTRRNGKILINGIDVINRDIEASNGTIYVIDGILFPRRRDSASY